jgi:hypothetical protein
MYYIKVKSSGLPLSPHYLDKLSDIDNRIQANGEFLAQA